MLDKAQLSLFSVWRLYIVTSFTFLKQVYDEGALQHF